MVCGMVFSIGLLMILLCFRLETDVPILQNKTICKILIKTYWLLETLCFAVCFGQAGHMVDFDLQVMCCLSVIHLLQKIALLLVFSESNYMYIFCCLSGCGVGPTTL